MKWLFVVGAFAVGMIFGEFVILFGVLPDIRARYDNIERIKHAPTPRPPVNLYSV